jgi:predicted transcriptional regulator of viral defense system
MAEYAPFQQRKRMTRLGEAVAKALNAQPKSLLTNYEIYRELWRIFETGETPYLRSDTPNKEIFRRTRSLLRKEGIIRHDSDYSSLWRVMTKPDASPEDIICSVDPDCYISHLSAMQRYGITNRRPESLFITQPTPQARKQKLQQLMANDYGEALISHKSDIELARVLSHPRRIRGRHVAFHATKYFGEHVEVKGSFSRIATIGQTFLDMLDLPDHCGGIAHVLETWSEHARTYLEEVISAVDATDKPILKVRAGYVLDEHLAFDDSRIQSWLHFAQRGSSRVLNAGKPFNSNHSEKWMISINV